MAAGRRRAPTTDGSLTFVSDRREGDECEVDNNFGWTARDETCRVTVRVNSMLKATSPRHSVERTINTTPPSERYHRNGK